MADQENYGKIVYIKKFLIKEIVMKLSLMYLTLFIIFSFGTQAQNIILTPEQKNEIIAHLDSSNFQGAITTIKKYNIEESRDKIEQIFWNDRFDKLDQLIFLRLLYRFGSPLTQSYTLAYIDSLDNLPSDYFGPTREMLKAEAASILVYIGDNSMIYLIFEYTDEAEYNYFFETLNVLGYIIENVGVYELKAKEELIGFVKNSDWHYDTILAFEPLYRKYGTEMYPLMLEMFTQNEDPNTRLAMLDSLIICCRYPELHLILKERLHLDSNYYVRYKIAHRLLSIYGTPSDYKYVLNYLPSESNSFYRDFIHDNLEIYYPPKPDSTEMEPEIIDSLISFKDQTYEYGWINYNNTYNTLSDKLNDIRTEISAQSWANALIKTNNYLQYVENALHQNNITEDAYKFLWYYGVYLKERLVGLVPQSGSFEIKLIDSKGSLLTTGTLKYYEGGWKDAVDNGDGTFTVNTEQNSVSLRMNYEYASQTISNVSVTSDTFAFQTVNTQVQLQDSQGNPIVEEATVKYYSGGWRDFGTTISGVAEKELLPNNYSFRMNYAYASNDKKQDTEVDPVVVFQTVSTQVKLEDSQGNPIVEEATVKYYSGGWREFAATVNGVAEKELLPNNYSFRMSYAYASNDKKQDTEVDPVVVFQTVNTQVQLQDSQGNPITEEAAIKYYSGGWRDFGATVNGVAAKELLPNNYSFRMNYAFASNDKKQDTEIDPVVVFQTVNTQVKLQDSQGNPIVEEATVKYYSGGWRDFGATVNGVAEKELLPNNYSFRTNYAYASNDKKQDTEVDPVIVFQTVNTQVELRDSQGNPINEEGTVKYYSGGWREFGSTINGSVSKELLPNDYSFRMSYEFISNDKKQDVGVNNIVTFSTVLCTVDVKDDQAQPIDNAVVKYYAGGWRDFGNTVNGIVTKELLPASISFRATYNSIQEQVQQNISSNSTVEFILNTTE